MARALMITYCILFVKFNNLLICGTNEKTANLIKQFYLYTIYDLHKWFVSRLKKKKNPPSPHRDIVPLYSDSGTSCCQNILIIGCSWLAAVTVKKKYSSMLLWQKLIKRLTSVNQGWPHMDQNGSKFSQSLI